MKKFLASFIFVGSLLASVNGAQAIEPYAFESKKEQLQYRTEMMRGERHFYVIKTYEAIEKTFKLSIGFIVLLLIYTEYGDLEKLGDLEKINDLKKIKEYLFEQGLQKIKDLAAILLSVQLVYQKRQRDNFNRNMDALLQKHIDPQCDFKSLPIEHAMLLMAAHEKNSEMVQALAPQQEGFLAQKGVKEALSELLGEENREQLLRGTGE